MSTTPTTPRVRPILRWPGGKSRMLKHLLPLIPAHVTYCEPFAGGLAVLMAKPRSKVEVVNDVNKDLTGLYRSLQFHLPEMLRQIDYFFSSRQNLHDFREQPGLTEIQRAARYLLRNRTSFGGSMDSFAVAKTKGGGAGFDRLTMGDLLGKAHERLNNVVVENLPYERCFKNYDSAENFFFIDPPYLNKPTGAYEGWTEAQMRELRRQVARLKGQWIVTVDDSELNRELFSDCHLRAVSTKSGLVNNATSPKAHFGELIITPS